MTINNFPNENEEKLFFINPDPCVIETSQFEIDRFKFRIDVYPEYFPGNYGVTLFTDSDLPISLKLKVKAKCKTIYKLNILYRCSIEY